MAWRSLIRARLGLVRGSIARLRSTDRRELSQVSAHGTCVMHKLFLSMRRWAWVRATVSLTRSAWRNPDPSPNPKSCRLVQRAPCTPEGVPWRGCGDAALGELRVQRVHLLTATKPASSVGPHCRSTACQGPERLRRPGSTLCRRAAMGYWLSFSTLAHVVHVHDCASPAARHARLCRWRLVRRREHEVYMQLVVLCRHWRICRKRGELGVWAAKGWVQAQLGVKLAAPGHAACAQRQRVDGAQREQRHCAAGEKRHGPRNLHDAPADEEARERRRRRRCTETGRPDRCRATATSDSSPTRGPTSRGEGRRRREL